ncbi:unnamed protein product [Hymenolepis diminuta]|uniref:UL2 n=1 Tax=Hymenolepis diminuta TaxID=6216 RepID=A0A0R3SB28_HYMDI|nr:unnamed protein product [Hymenolepis diminuta]VUZ48517.1 unnamed protein product [Hymenolepis diminuta]
MHFRRLIRRIWRRITGRDSSSSTNNDDNEGRRRRRRRWCRSSPIPYYRPNPGWPPDYGSDTPDTDDAQNRQSRAPLPCERPQALTPPPPYPGPEPPPPYPASEQAVSVSASEIEGRGRETSESIYGETIYEFATFRSLPELTATSASSSELDRRDRHPTSVHAGVLRKKR